LHAVFAYEAPFVNFVFSCNGYTSRSSCGDFVNLIVVLFKERYNFWIQSRFFWWESVTLSMHVKAPRVKIWSTVANVPSFALTINRIDAITSTCYNKSVEITYSNFINFLLVELFKLPYFLSFYELIRATNTKRTINIRPWKFKLIYNTTLILGSLKLNLH
jgi:hypothetical protein